MSQVRRIASNSSLVNTKIVADAPEFIPKYKSDGAACADLVANVPEGEVEIGPGRTAVIDCGFRMQIPAGFEVQVRARTSMARKGVVVTNGPGTIDDDYRGRVMVILTNTGLQHVRVRHLERVAQIAIKPVWYFHWEEVEELDDTERGDGAFGSTGSTA